MFRRSLALAAVGLVAASSFAAMPAQAAVKKVTIANGVVCPTLGKTAKSNGYTYKCFLNTVVSKTKKTWTTTDCISADAQWRKSNASYKALAAAMPATLAELDIKIAAEIAKGVEAAAKADGLQLQINEWKAKIVEFTAKRTTSTSARDTLNAKPTKTAQDTASIMDYNRAITTYTSAIGSLNSSIRAATAAQVSLRLVGKTAETMKVTKTQATQNLTQAKAGVAQGLSMRALICQKGL